MFVSLEGTGSVKKEFLLEVGLAKWMALECFYSLIGLFSLWVSPQQRLTSVSS